MNINLTLIGQMVAFLVFVAFCMRYVWPPIMAAMEERQQKIADGLAAADRASHDLELAQKEAVDRLAEAKKEAAGIVDSANKRAATLIDEAKAAAVVEADRVKELANAEVEREKAQAKEQLMAQVSALAISGAEKVLAAEIDADKHANLLKQLVEEQ
ncbi:MAG: F0F1 ATP synthase subunit B [Halieaceae bacterium MED-G27]|nr:F0F1 ATP synthase subunit B [Halieaceae bacterium]MAV74771.1 F0F1 ATP synthase subunit B [Halieaceae bacterium]OUT64393.1 MAG: F0F1 ATP synthase subunit B [Cellvibrionales bacterium TMED21]OUT64954.1 MAG: F0F1 ATP synthase subunit B [Cellvibrionales bacterium TMED21]PDH37578.1 MAG: F0F1 ATP synthase subunit B [Halieaceae bacterium MED-G27]